MFRAYDATRERLVAVKLFKLDLPPERGHQLVAEFERLIAAELTHPAMAAPLATGISGVSAFLAQDYVAADSLDSVVREYGPAPAGNALRVATQLAGALDFAAAVYVTHGALHPRDVLLSSDETRLTGLGVARALERIGVVAPVRRPYTAPERIAGAEWDRRADIFSLAALTHELLWGRRISGVGMQAAESLTAVEGTRLGELKRVFARALAELPADRYGSALEFAEALRLACPDVAVAPEPAPSKRRGGREVEPRLPLDGEPESLSGGDPQAAVAEVIPSPAAPIAEEAGREPLKRGKRRVPQSSEPDIAEPVAPPLRPADPAFSAEDGAPVPEGSVDAAAVAQGFSPADLDLAPVAPAQLEGASLDLPTVMPPGFITGHDPDVLSALEVTRTAVWPLVLALGVGIAIGFAGGFFTGTREQMPPSPAVAAAPAPAAAAGREFTEAAVAAAPAKSDVRSQKSEADASKAEAPKAVAPTVSPPPSAERKTPNPEPNGLKPEISAPKSPGSDGRLLVRSRPAGARVSVDGKDRGVTPAAIRDLARGAHRVKISQDGYVADERRVVISASKPAHTLTVALVRARAAAPAAARGAPAPAPAFAGALSVDSRPAGAKVFMDGALVGTTPMSLPSIPAGSHAIRLEHDGYRRWSSSVRVVAYENNRVTASLER